MLHGGRPGFTWKRTLSKCSPAGKCLYSFFTFSAQPPAGVYLASKTTGIRRQWGLIAKCLEVSFLRHTVYSDTVASRSRNKQSNKKYSLWPACLPFILKIAWLLTELFFFWYYTNLEIEKKICFYKAWHCYFGRYFFESVCFLECCWHFNTVLFSLYDQRTPLHPLLLELFHWCFLILIVKVCLGYLITYI